MKRMLIITIFILVLQAVIAQVVESQCDTIKFSWQNDKVVRRIVMNADETDNLFQNKPGYSVHYIFKSIAQPDTFYVDCSHPLLSGDNAPFIFQTRAEMINAFPNADLSYPEGPWESPPFIINMTTEQGDTVTYMGSTDLFLDYAVIRSNLVPQICRDFSIGHDDLALWEFLGIDTGYEFYSNLSDDYYIIMTYIESINNKKIKKQKDAFLNYSTLTIHINCHQIQSIRYVSH